METDGNGIASQKPMSEHQLCLLKTRSPASNVKYCNSESLCDGGIIASSHKPLQLSLTLVNQIKSCRGITKEVTACLWFTL